MFFCKKRRGLYVFGMKETENEGTERGVCKYFQNSMIIVNTIFALREKENRAARNEKPCCTGKGTARGFPNKRSVSVLSGVLTKTADGGLEKVVSGGSVIWWSGTKCVPLQREKRPSPPPPP